MGNSHHYYHPTDPFENSFVMGQNFNRRPYPMNLSRYPQPVQNLVQNPVLLRQSQIQQPQLVQSVCPQPLLVQSIQPTIVQQSQCVSQIQPQVKQQNISNKMTQSTIGLVQYQTVIIYQKQVNQQVQRVSNQVLDMRLSYQSQRAIVPQMKLSVQQPQQIIKKSYQQVRQPEVVQNTCFIPSQPMFLQQQQNLVQAPAYQTVLAQQPIVIKQVYQQPQTTYRVIQQPQKYENYQQDQNFNMNQQNMQEIQNLDDRINNLDQKLQETLNKSHQIEKNGHFEM